MDKVDAQIARVAARDAAAGIAWSVSQNSSAARIHPRNVVFILIVSPYQQVVGS